MRLLTVLVSIVITLSAAEEVKAQRVPDVSIVREQGFIDINLGITSTESNADGMLIIKAEGQSNGRVVGFSFEILPGWKADKKSNSGFAVQWGRVRIRSIGQESDRFVALLSREYALGKTYSVMAPLTEFPAVSLEGNPANISSGPLRMKLFYEGMSEDRYAEVYANIDLRSKRLEFHEKDPSYRVPIVRALSAGT
jgi:hypothetical protein